MLGIGKSFEAGGISELKAKAEGFMKITPESNASFADNKNFWKNLFKNSVESYSISEVPENDKLKIELEKTLKEYLNELRNVSDCPETISQKPFDISDLKKISPEENARQRDEFDDKKIQLKEEWEVIHGRSWPKYTQDVYSQNGKLIRKAGSDYDAHHIQPIGMGGQNTAENITPLGADVHYDRQGIHSPETPYSKMEKMLGEMKL